MTFVVHVVACLKLPLDSAAPEARGPEKAENERTVLGVLCLVKATTLNLGQRDRSFCDTGSPA